MTAYIKLIRLHHWVKNLFVFVPIFFAGQAFNINTYSALTLGFLCFGLIASSVYILNDFRDRSVDRLHPVKRLRPLASGKANVAASLTLMTLMLLAGFVLAYMLNFHFFLLLGTYFVINIAYSLGLKNIGIVDIFLVSSGFMLRIYAGGVLGDVPISHWLAIMAMLLSLFLALAKRRDDLVLSKDGQVLRKSSRNYNLEFVNSCLTLFSGIMIVAYIMYTVSEEVIHRMHTKWLFTTTIFVIAGIMRYLQITFVEQNSGSPTSLLYKDRFIMFTILGWIITFYIIIYIA